MEKFKSPRCQCCGQTTQYIVRIDRGAVDILKAMARKIHMKGVNAVNPRKEMEVGSREKINYKDMVTMGMMTSIHVGNLSKARFHGLIARIESGQYCITDKGFAFLKGEKVPKFAVVDKTTSSNIGYWGFLVAGKNNYWCSIDDFKPDMEYWEGIKYNVINGTVVTDESRQGTLVN